MEGVLAYCLCIDVCECVSTRARACACVGVGVSVGVCARACACVGVCVCVCAATKLVLVLPAATSGPHSIDLQLRLEHQVVQTTRTGRISVIALSLLKCAAPAIPGH